MTHIDCVHCSKTLHVYMFYLDEKIVKQCVVLMHMELMLIVFSCDLL
jgi:hypothetical protein